jgi:hypothetical protein
MMKRLLLCIGFQLVLAGSLIADSNMHITDVGLHDYSGTPLAVRLVIRNPSSQPQPIHLRLAASNEYGVTNTVTIDFSLNGGEQRDLELPILLPPGKTAIVADASAAGAVFGHDTYEGTLRQPNLIVLMCADENVCKTAQSQIQFSGTIEDRVDKNRQIAFEMVHDPRDHWWAYSAASAVVLAMPMAMFTPAQRDALEGFLRRGGRLILVEHEIADRSFLSTYREGAALHNGERVGKGTLFRVSDLGANVLGDTFAGANLPAFLIRIQRYGINSNQTGLLFRRFATAFNFPRLRWVLIWLVAYTVIIGAVNFAVLRRLHRLEFGWISVCGLALLFAAGFYFSSASQRPKSFHIDNLATYYLDGRSPLAAADYNLRVSAPERRDVMISVAAPAVFTNFTSTREEPNSQIWSEMNRQGMQMPHEYDILLGPPSQIELSFLKWSFQDLNMEGLHEFSGTVHLVAPNRLRNDTGQQFSEAVYLDYTSNAVFTLPALAPGKEIQLDAITPRQIRTQGQTAQTFVSASFDYSKVTLQELALTGELGLAAQGRVFVGFCDGPALPVELNVSHQESVHSLIVVTVEQP